MSVPNEIWLSIFEHLESPADLAAVVRTNRRFKTLALRVLYKHLVWSDPTRLVKNIQFLDQNPSLHPVVRALTLGITTAVDGQLARIEQISRAKAIVQFSGNVSSVAASPYRSHETRILDDIGILSPIELLASEELATPMYNHFSSFVNLRDLTFTSMLLPDSFYELVHSFPALDRLAIENCTAPIDSHPTHLHPRDLPITHLSILGLRGRKDPRELRAFGEGRNLRVIRFDYTCYIYKHFSEPPSPPTQPNNFVQGFVALLPPGVNNLNNLPPLHVLHPHHTYFQQPFLTSQPEPIPSPHIHTIDVKFPTRKSWQSYVAEPHDQLINPFADFLEKCPSLTNLSIRNYLPWLRLSDTAIPILTCYQGPLTTIKSVVSGPRRPNHLTIRDPTGGLAALEKAFKEIDASGANLDVESLSVCIGWWDDEILYAVLHHFPDLKRLEIMYREGDPTEETVLGMGAHFFGRMSHLWCVRVFKVVPPENLGARGYPQRSIDLALELAGVDVSDRGELDDAEFDDTKLGITVERVTSPEEQEQDVLKELIHAWNRYCPALREVQLKPGYVWRRAGTDDVWARRVTKMNHMRNAGFEEA